MHDSTTIRRMSARTAVAMLLAVVGMLALGGAWNSAFAANDNNNGNGGANNSGPYDPTPDCQGTNQGNSPNCNGSQSGPSDEKNPPGQVNNTHDRGYECDDNKGVGDHGGNPAHTGCATTTTTSTTSTTIHNSNCTTDCPCTVNCGGGGCVSDCGGTTNVNTPNSPNAEVLGLTEEAPSSGGASATTPGANVAGTELAFTGATSDVLGFLGLALLAFGTAFILVARKPKEITVL